MTTREISQLKQRSRTRVKLSAAFLIAAQQSGKRIIPSKRYIKDESRFVVIGKEIKNRRV